MFAFEKLDAWHRCHELTLEVYRVTRSWPKHEQFGLISQIRRCAVSAEADIAEGSAKRTAPEFRRYLDISLGSHAEIACLVRIASDLGYVSRSELEGLEQFRTKASQVTWGLYQHVSRRVKSQR